jgi:hypothetical protein
METVRFNKEDFGTKIEKVTHELAELTYEYEGVYVLRKEEIITIMLKEFLEQEEE